MPPSDAAPAPACTLHPARLATFRCAFCEQAYCGACAQERTLADRTTVRACPSCGGRCASLVAAAAASSAVVPAALARPTEPAPGGWLSGELWRDLATYAFRDHGVIQLGGAGVLLLLASLAGFWGLPLLAYVWAFFLQVVVTSANGKQTLPDWPDFRRSESIESLWHVFCSRFLITFPAVAYHLFVLERGHGSQAIYYALEVLAALLLPMVMLAVILHETPSAIDPRLILPSIARTAGAYLPMAVIFWVVNTSAEVVESVALRTIVIGWLDLPMPFQLIACLTATLRAWALVISCRCLGLFYRAQAAKLAWF